jgi:hypothetical protein
MVEVGVVSGGGGGGGWCAKDEDETEADSSRCFLNDSNLD